MKYLPSLACILGAIYLIIIGNQSFGIGWLLFGGYLLYPSSNEKE